MICEDCKIEPVAPVTAKAEILTCKRCGCLYPSIGKGDSGYCRDCKNTLDVLLKGGPLDGMRNSGLLEVDE